MKNFNFNGIISFVCCLVIALGLNDVFFANKLTDGLISVAAGTVLMPGIMTWDYKQANKYQKIGLVGIALLYVSFIGYLVYRYFVR
jgi:hypothetical protein